MRFRSGGGGREDEDDGDGKAAEETAAGRSFGRATAKPPVLAVLLALITGAGAVTALR